MKFIYFSSTLLVATTAWSQWSLIAKVEETLWPLSGTFVEVNGTQMNALSFGPLSKEPTEFSLQNGFAFTKYKSAIGYLGIYCGMLGFAPNIPKFFLEFDGELKIKNGPFHACDLIPHQVYIIYYGQVRPETNCFKIYIYFLPYNEKTKAIMEVPPSLKNNSVQSFKLDVKHSFGKRKTTNAFQNFSVSSHDGKTNKKKKRKHKIKKYKKNNNKVSENGIPERHLSSLTESFELPLVFFAKINGKLIPLSGTRFKNGKADSTVLSYGSMENPVSVSFRDNYAVSDKGFIGFYKNMLAFGPEVVRTPLNLDSESKVLNVLFFSCSFNNTHWIYGQTYRNTSDCFRVDLYLLPYNRSTGSYVLGMHGFQSDEKTVSPEFPLVFAAYINGFLVPLSGKPFEPISSQINVFSYSDFEDIHVEFDWQENFAIAKGATSSGYVGFFDGYFVFGPGIQKEKLILSPKRKVLNYPFYSCVGTDGVVHAIAHSFRPSEECSQVDIYLLPYNRTISDYGIQRPEYDARSGLIVNK